MKTSKPENKIQKTQKLKLFISLFFWKEDRSLKSQYIYEVLSNLQLISIAFLGSSKALSMSTGEGYLMKWAQNIAEIFCLMNQSSIIEDDIAFSIIFAFICVYFLGFISLIVLTFFKIVKEHKVSDTLHRWLTYWMQSHHTLLFWFLNVFLFPLLSKALSKNAVIFNIKDNNEALVAGIIVLCVINFFLGLMGAMFCYDPFLNKNPMASYNSTFQNLTFLYKAMIGPIIYLMNEGTLEWVFAGVSFGLTFFRYEIVLYDVPFYNYTSMKLCSFLGGSALSIALVTIIIAVVTSLSSSTILNSIDFIYVSVVAIFLLIKLTKLRIHFLIERNMYLQPSALKTEQDVFKRIFSLSYFSDHSKHSLSFASKSSYNRALLYMTGEMLSHNTICSDTECTCHYLLGKKNNVGSGLFKLYKVNRRWDTALKLALLRQAINSIKGSNILKILYSFILVKQEKKFLDAQLMLSEIPVNQRSFQDDILISTFNRKCEEEMSNFPTDNKENNKKGLNTRQFIDIETDSEQLFLFIKQNTEYYTELWTFYQKNNLSLNDFMIKSYKFEKEAEKIQRIWAKMSTQNDNLPSYISVLYSTYIFLVRNVPSQAEKIYSRIVAKQEQILDGMKHQNIDSSDIIFYISMSKERLGRVLHVSRNIYKELGWFRAEILKQNINLIQPPFIREKHNQILLNHKEKCIGKVNSSFNLFAHTKEGFLVPIHGQITIFPYVEAEPIYIGIIQRKEIKREIMVVRSNGIVDSFSKGLSKELGLEPFSKIHINQICSEFTTVMKNFNDAGAERHGLMPHEQIMLTFQVNCSKTEGLGNKEVTYYVQKNELILLGERFLCLYLSFYKNSEGVYKKQSTRKTTNMIEEMLADEVPIEFESSPDAILTKFTESPLLTQFQTTFGKTRQSVSYSLHQNSLKRTLLTQTTPNSPVKQFDSLMIKSEARLTEFKEVTEAKKELFMREDSQEGSVSSKKKTDVENKIEQAVYRVPKPRYMKILNSQVGFFAILCVCLLCFQLVDSLEELDGLSQKIDLIASCQKASYYLAFINIRARMLTLISRGIFSDKRHINIGITSYSATLKGTFQSFFKGLTQVNTQIIQNIHTLDKNTQEKIYSIRIPVLRNGSKQIERTFSQFETMTEVANAVNILSRMNLYNISLDDPVLNFILDNTVNEPLLGVEQMFDAMTRNYESNLYRIKDKTSLILIIASVSGSIIMITLFLHIKEIIVKRNQFILVLQTINENRLKEHLHLVSQFSNTLTNENFSIKTYEKIRSDLIEQRELLEFKETKRKNLESRKGLNNQIIKGVIFTIAAIGIFISVFGILSIKFDSKLEDFLRKKDKMVIVNEIRSHIILQNLCFLTYLSQTSEIYVRNIPVGNELNRFFADTEHLVDMMAKLADEIEGTDRAILQSMLIGDYCKYMIHPLFPVVLCSRISQAIGSIGVIGLISNYARVQNNMRTTFDQSGRLYEVAFSAINSKDQILYEQISVYMDVGVEMIEVMFRNNLRSTMGRYRDEIILIIFVYGAIYLVLGCFLSLKVWRDMNKEREKCRKIMRQIPLSIILSNRALKSYLVNDCENVLDSYKNVI